jgi:hypothetical protein
MTAVDTTPPNPDSAGGAAATSLAPDRGVPAGQLPAKSVFAKEHATDELPARAVLPPSEVIAKVDASVNAADPRVSNLLAPAAGDAPASTIRPVGLPGRDPAGVLSKLSAGAAGAAAGGSGAAFAALALLAALLAWALPRLARLVAIPATLGRSSYLLSLPERPG